MVQHVDRITRARNKGHVGHSGDGDTVALESRRARTLAARKARASKRLQQAVTAVAEQIEAIGAPSPTLDQLASRVQRLE